MFISFLFRFGILAIGLAGLTAVIYMVTVHAGVVRLPSYELDKITRAEGEIRSGAKWMKSFCPTHADMAFLKKTGPMFMEISLRRSRKDCGKVRCSHPLL